MKGWEYMNMLKGTHATRQQIWDWLYMNKLEPIDLLVINNLSGINSNALELPEGFSLSPQFIKAIEEHPTADYPDFENYRAVLDCEVTEP